MIGLFLRPTRFVSIEGFKDPLINLSHPLALRQIVSQGAVPQEGWLPFKVLQRGEAICLKAPPGAVLTAIRCVVPLAKD